MASTVALLVACLVSLSADQAADVVPPGPPPGPAAPCQDATLPVREGFDLTASYLSWWWKRGVVPPLLTTSAPADRGVLGAPSTQVLFGGTDIGASPFSGGRFSGIAFLDPTWDLELGGFFLTERRVSFATGSDLAGSLLAIPIIDTRTGQESSIVLADPGITAGAYTARLISQLWGLHFTGIAHVGFGDHWHLMLTGGVRYTDYTEALRLGSRLQSPFIGQFEGQLVDADSVIRGFDRFHARNQFIGGLLGVQAEFKLGNWIVTTRAQCAIGGTRGQVNIHGVAYLNTPAGATDAVLSNILAQPTNIGGYGDTRVTFLPEGTVTLGYEVSRNVTLFAGYDLFYWSQVVRPGDQITRRVNPDLVPFLGTANQTVAPQQPPLVWTHLLAQGISCGVQLSF